ncbi:hypothetical protein AB0F36_14500 [Streptomyces sp. NPDC029080]|uniref:hypothetical protein n=1 Tax=Streptomyces sp. NPDC029080 TaxID=3155017 RepID=UPI0033E78711
MSTAELAELQRLQRRERELQAEVDRLTAENRELTAAADASRNFRADLAAGHITLDLDTWGTP